MKIIGVETVLVSYPAPMKIVSSSASVETVDCALVTVRTDAGVDGFGYVYILGGNPITPIREVLDYLQRTIVGLDPRETERIWDTMWRRTAFIGPRGVPCFALSAIDTALWDIKGKVAGKAVHALLGAQRERLQAYWSGLFLNASLDELCAEARAKVAEGWRVLKMRLGGRLALEENAARVRAVREAVGDGITILTDVSRQMDVPTAITTGRMLQEYNIGWFEDPVPPEDVRGHATVAAALDVPIATGELAYSRYDFQVLQDARAADIWMPDLERVGGITEWLRVGNMAQQAGIPMASHVFHEVSVHVLAALPTTLYLEYLPLWEPLFRQPLVIERGEAVLPTAPGLGLDVDWDFVERYRCA